ncbi:uncharacterized protein LOC100568897 [Acyrthosiphon pisum]|uniref:Uncharacterized protein n=1 Tax=Acyrthosiphon pisum TaxID=7029 RepID=A0A8R1W5Y0_ACYPI|nr:uncharacterized protein LOC100568897 [Acyrthosiphon pisum]|eukprot:XP_003245185.1 PREDICTED: uncharacterized protein LOC100568897 [Acyrthosiphon pisum]
MDFENSDSDSLSAEFDFRGDAAPTSMDPYRDDVISDRQQSILNDLRIHLCRENFIYLNNHKEVEAIAMLLINDILKKSPKDPYRHAASYLKNPSTAYLVANFKRSEDFQYEDIIKKDDEQYATADAEQKMSTCEHFKSVVTMDEQTEELQDGETDMAADQYNLLTGDGETSYVMEGEAEMTIS